MTPTETRAHWPLGSRVVLSARGRRVLGPHGLRRHELGGRVVGYTRDGTGEEGGDVRRPRKLCQALDNNAQRCHRRAVRWVHYHGDHELYVHADQPSWVGVWLCAEHAGSLS